MLVMKKFNPPQLLKASSYILGSSIIVNITRVLLIVILTRYYTKEEFGIWATITSSAAVLATGDFGITNALRNKISTMITLSYDGLNKASEYFYSMLIFLSLFVSVVIVLLFIFRQSIPIDSLFKTNDLFLQKQAVDIFFWIQIMYLINIPLNIGIPLFFSFRESSKAAIFTILQSLISFIIIIILAVFNANIVVISLTYFGVNVFISAIGTLYFIYVRKWYYYRIRFRRFIEIIKEIFPQGLKFMLLQVGSSLLQNAGTICLSASVSVSVAAEFNVVQKLYTFFVGIYQSILNPIWGELAASYALKQAIRCKKIIVNSTLCLIVIFSLFMAFLCVGGNWIITVFAGSEYVTSKAMFISIGLISFFYLIYANISTLQNATGHIWLMTLLNTCIALLLIPLTKSAPELGAIKVSLCLAFFWALLSVMMGIQAYRLINKIRYENN